MALRSEERGDRAKVGELERAQFQRFEAEEAVGKNNGWAGTIHARTQRPLLWLHQSHPVAASLSPRPHCHGLGVNLTRESLIKIKMACEREVLVEGFLLQGFQEGKFTPDVALLMKPVIGLMIAEMAEDENIPFRLFENDDAMDEGKMDDRTFLSMMKNNNPRMFDFIREKVNATIREGTRPAAPREENFMSMKKAEGEE